MKYFKGSGSVTYEFFFNDKVGLDEEQAKEFVSRLLEYEADNPNSLLGPIKKIEFNLIEEEIND